MRIKNVTGEQMRQALEAVNQKYKGNILFKRFEPAGRVIHFTLTVRDAAAPGGRRGHHRNRRVKAACWHVHGDFYDAIIELEPRAVIYTRGYVEKPGSRGGRSRMNEGEKITKDGGNWQDWNAGSMIEPRAMSDMCDCGLEQKQRDHETAGWLPGNVGVMRQIRQDSLTAECWGVQAWGLGYCESCEYLNSEDCGGQDIRRTLKNEKGLAVPVDHTPDSSTNN
jgi:hypothetical protein